MKKYIWKNKAFIALGFIFLIVAWEFAAKIINNDIYLPKIEEVISSIFQIMKDDSFSADVFSSIYRTVISFMAALIFATVLGVMCIISDKFSKFLMPFNAIIKTVPTMVLVVLALIWFDKDKTPYVVGALIVFPIFYEGITNSIKNVDKKLIQMCSIYNIKLSTRIKNIYIPIILMYLGESFVASFSLAFKVVIAGEVHGQPKYGIGSSIQNAKANFEVSTIFGWIIIIAVISIIFEGINIILQRKIANWRK